MDLNRLRGIAPELNEFAFAKDNSRVLDFIRQHSMSVGRIELVYDRAPDFQRLLRMQGEGSATIMSVGVSDRLMGLFSISTQQRLYHGKSLGVGYIGDFRSDGSRQMAKVWRQSYGPILRQFSKEPGHGQAAFFLTAILKDNEAARRNLESKRRELGFKYQLLEQQTMVNVIGRKLPASKTNLRVERAEAADENEIRGFLAGQENKFFWAFDWNLEWERRQKSWPGFAAENFLLIRRQKKIVAAVLPWSPSAGAAKVMRVQRADRLTRIGFSLARTLGWNTPTVGGLLETLYLSCLHTSDSVDHADAVEAFLLFLHKHGEFKANHMISVAERPQAPLPLRSWLKVRTPVCLYQVHVAGQEPAVYDGRPVAFEMSTV